MCEANDTVSEVVTLARGLVRDMSDGLLAEQRQLPKSIFGTPVPRHYEIGVIRDALGKLEAMLCRIDDRAERHASSLRSRPYTELSRAKCTRCGLPAMAEWSTCAIGNRYVALCMLCDVGLNRVALGYVLGMDAAAAFVARYEGHLHERAQNQITKGLRHQRRRRRAVISAGRERTAPGSRRGQEKAEQVAGEVERATP